MTGFCLILPVIEKNYVWIVFNPLYSIQLNLLYLLNLSWCQFFYLTNYQDSFKSSSSLLHIFYLSLNLFKIDFPSKKGNNNYIWRSSLFSEVMGCRPLVYFNFPIVSILIKMRMRNSVSSDQVRMKKTNSV